jgi:hypothetical protein
MLETVLPQAIPNAVGYFGGGMRDTSAKPSDSSRGGDVVYVRCLSYVTDVSRSPLHQSVPCLYDTSNREI